MKTEFPALSPPLLSIPIFAFSNIFLKIYCNLFVLKNLMGPIDKSQSDAFWLLFLHDFSLGLVGENRVSSSIPLFPHLFLLKYMQFYFVSSDGPMAASFQRLAMLAPE